MFVLEDHQVLNYIAPSSDSFLPVGRWVLSSYPPARDFASFLHSFTKAQSPSSWLNVALERIFPRWLYNGMTELCFNKNLFAA